MKEVKRSEEEIEYAFDTFVEGVQKMVTKHYQSQYSNLDPPKIVVLPGRVYWKVIKEEDNGGSSCSVFSFVRKSDGAIFKPATWHGPYTKGASAIRGYVNDPKNGLSSVTPYGVVYAK